MKFSMNKDPYNRQGVTVLFLPSTPHHKEFAGRTIVVFSYDPYIMEGLLSHDILL